MPDFHANLHLGPRRITVKYVTCDERSLDAIADDSRYAPESLDSMIDAHFSNGSAEIESITINQTQSLRLTRIKPMRIRRAS